MQGTGESRGVAILTLQLYAKCGLVDNDMPLPLYPSENGLGTHCVEGWVGPKICLNECQEEAIICSSRGLNPKTSSA